MRKNSLKKISPYHIKYWPIWLLMGILWCMIQIFSYRFLLKIGKTLGICAQFFSPYTKCIAQINIARCFTHYSKQQQKILLRESYISMGIGAIETLLGWWGSEKKLKKLASISGLEHIQTALKKNKGVLVITPHFSSVHLAGQLANFYYPFSVMFLPPKNPVFYYLSIKSMQRVYQKAILRNNARGLLTALKNNHAIFYTPDTDGGKKGIFIPFFGTLASTVTAPARLASASKCAVIAVTCCRKKDASGYKIDFHPPLAHYPSGNLQQDILAINQLIEKFIYTYPEQYIWQYKRFKTRPPGEKSFYPNR